MKPDEKLKEYKDLSVEQAEKVAETLTEQEDPHEWAYLTKDETVLARGKAEPGGA
jgi:hypothetical protein